MSVSCKYWALFVCILTSFPLFSQTSFFQRSFRYLELNLNGTGGQTGNPFAGSNQSLDIFRVIERAAKDKKINGIVLNISDVSGSLDTSRAFLWEIRNALEQFKSSGKKICAFISNADIDVYFLASIADKIVMDELGTLSMLGYSVNRSYVQHSLEKLGIGVRELRYLEYKSASETFSRDSMSEADRRQYSEYLDDIFNLTRNTLKITRNWTDEEFDAVINRDFLYSAKSAQNRNLVDRVGRKDAVLEALKELEGAEVRQFSLYGSVSSSLLGENSIYKPPGNGGIFRRPPIIAVVYASGQTDMERGMEALNLSMTIRELADKTRVKAIVIKIDSPGGSADAADYFAEAVRYAKQKKPVVVSMGEVAASGGYWAAMYASHITATPFTITGSIGVIGSWFYDNGLSAKLGISSDTIQRGAHADLLSGTLLPYRNLTVDEENRYKSYILDIYSVFIEKAAAGRSMKIEDVEAVAQGRIFSGLRALDSGLIDSVGGLSDALRTARTIARISDKQRIRYDEYPKPGFFDKLLERLPFVSAFIKRQSRAGTFSLLADRFLPDTDIIYRLNNNGKIMPILPLGY